VVSVSYRDTRTLLILHSDFNYERQKDGSCALVQGFTPPDHSLVCADENRIDYDDPTGYRRIPLTTCQGGKEMDKSVAHACPGKGKEFNQKHGPSVVGVFFAIMIPFALAGGVGYWVWRNWTSKFGQIRLGEQCEFLPLFHKMAIKAFTNCAQQPLMTKHHTSNILWWSLLALRLLPKPFHSLLLASGAQQAMPGVEGKQLCERKRRLCRG
jgi:hypothetical protein